MPELCIRIHCEGTAYTEGIAYLKSISRRWFVARHSTDRPHYHLYVDTDKKEQTVRVQLKRRLQPENDRLYSVSTMRDDIHKYYSYVMLKPESSELTHGVSFQPHDTNRQWDWDDVATKAKEYSENVATNRTSIAIKKINWFQQILEHCEWNICKTDQDNFETMFRFLIKNKWVNCFTIGKMQQIFHMWKAQHQTDDEIRVRSKDLFNEYIRW